MKAIAIEEYGDVKNLHEIELEVPKLAADEVLLKIMRQVLILLIGKHV